MPWNDQKGGGGPWGGGSGDGSSGSGGPKSPWDRPGSTNTDGPKSTSSDRPADIEESLRRMQSRFKKRGGGPGGGGRRGRSGGGKGMGTLGLGIILIIGLVGWLMTGVYQVDAGERAIVLRFGKIHRTAEPGFNIRLPNPIEEHFAVPVDDNKATAIGLSDEESLMLTQDENIVDIDFTINWRILTPQHYLFNVVDVVNRENELVRQVGESAMRQIVGTSNFQDITTGDRTGVELRVQGLMQETFDSYEAGIEVQSISLEAATAPPEVVQVQRDVTNAEQDRERRINEATAYRNDVVPRARGEARRLIQDAEGYKESQVSIARGEAERFNLIYGEYRQAPRVTRERMFLETMERVLGNTDQIILDSDAGAVPILPLDQLRRGSTQ